MGKNFIDDEIDTNSGASDIYRSNNNNMEKSAPTPVLDIIQDKPEKSTSDFRFSSLALLICIIGVSLGILLEIIHIRNKIPNDIDIPNRKYCIYSNSSDHHSKTGALKHVHLVLERIGYKKVANDTSCPLIWAHAYPFNKPDFSLGPHQKINQFPGIGFITSKVDLVTSTKSKYIPKAFRLPKDKEKFLEYAKHHKNAMFVQKNIKHRYVYLKSVNDIDITSGNSFVQEFVQNPFLVDGHKFDIGVYVVITSVNPLRVYWYAGDVLFRYCPVKYHPLDPLVYGKYVVADKYMPTWEVPSLAEPFTAFGYSMKESFDIYATSKGKNTARMWVDIQDAITEIFIQKEHTIVKALNKYESKENFFQLLRFDFIVDENLKVYLLEANLSPNLMSSWTQNQLLYEQVLYNLFLLNGVATKPARAGDNDTAAKRDEMVSTQKNIGVFGEICTISCKEDCRVMEVCQLCKPCLNPTMKKVLLAAYREKLHRGHFRRLIPPPTRQAEVLDSSFLEPIKNFTDNNRLLHLWYQGKCNQDVSWCT